MVSSTEPSAALGLVKSGGPYSTLINEDSRFCCRPLILGWSRTLALPFHILRRENYMVVDGSC